MKADREVVLVLGILEHHVETVRLSGRGQHETAVLEEMTGIGEFRPLDVAEGAGEVILPGEPRIRVGRLGREENRHRGQREKREKHHECFSHDRMSFHQKYVHTVLRTHPVERFRQDSRNDFEKEFKNANLFNTKTFIEP